MDQRKTNIFHLSCLKIYSYLIVAGWPINNILIACENHDRNIRFANNVNVVVPEQNVESFRNSFMYQDATTWNSFPPQHTNATTHCSFKRMYKKECVMHLHTLRKDLVILQLYLWLFSSTEHCG